jgi:GNAT superfamily N-acetyltransferase
MNEIIIRPAEMGEASYVSYFNMMLYRDQHDDETAQLRWFAVDKDYRGHGVGSKLMRAAKEFCQTVNIIDPTLYAFATGRRRARACSSG